MSRSAYNGWDRAVDLLLNKGVDVNARGYKGNTALHWAFLKLDYLKNCTRDDCPEKREKYRNIIKLLIKHRASQTILNDELKTPEQAKMKY